MDRRLNHGLLGGGAECVERFEWNETGSKVLSSDVSIMKSLVFPKKMLQ